MSRLFVIFLSITLDRITEILYHNINNIYLEMNIMTDKAQKAFAKLTDKDIAEILFAEINGTKDQLYEKGSVFDSSILRFNRTLSHDEMSELIEAALNDYLDKHNGEIGKYIITTENDTIGEYFSSVSAAQSRAEQLIPRLQRKNKWLTIRDRVTGEPVSTMYIAKFYTDRKWIA